MKKGFKLPPRSQEWCDNISKAKKGKGIGRKHTEETKRKQSISKIGIPRPRSVIDAMRKSNLGRKRTLESRKKQSETMIRNGSKAGINNPNYGIHKIGQLNPMYGKKGLLSPTFGRKHTPDEVQKMKEKRRHQIFPTKDSKPERMMQIALALNGIKFEKHKPILGQPDIFIEPNICIFVDGDYWHANPTKYNSEFIVTKKQGMQAKEIWSKDIRIQHELNRLGYQVIRLWESDIKKNVNDCAINIIKLIESLRSVSK